MWSKKNDGCKWEDIGNGRKECKKLKDDNKGTPGKFMGSGNCY
jgi:hypothetical protein